MAIPMTAHFHDPGGKVRIAIGDAVRGNARFFGPNQEYRPWLSRHWGDREFMMKDRDGNMLERSPYALWIGMNPSTADAAVNDPTVLKEIKFTRRLGLSSYIKCNVMDYRATKPKELRKAGVVPTSIINLETILHFARYADRIIVCYGLVHKSLQRYPDEAVQELRKAGHTLWCLGRTKAGHPRHPLYIKDDTELERYP